MTHTYINRRGNTHVYHSYRPVGTRNYGLLPLRGRAKTMGPHAYQLMKDILGTLAILIMVYILFWMMAIIPYTI